MACAVGTRAPVARLPRASAIGRRAHVAVMAPETNVSAEELAAEARRRGMGRRFADERSLDNPGELKGIRNFWYPVHFWSKLTKGDASPDFPLFGEEWTLVRTDAAGVAAARASIAFPGC